MAEIESKKKRSENFSANDCLLLAQIINEPVKEGSILTRYAYLKSRFNPFLGRHKEHKQLLQSI
ncbi:hypothetical protein DPMN_154899 [Dreissena polymorpha]|uniref:Uncharacterized protein n=1 Tax=Dreissena polymorpha TaxID=45954 RepID=A0A9D4FMY0_DREPO|nr:hypothetical protein DPMN_154899 [Dreissena polymorpha]